MGLAIVGAGLAIVGAGLGTKVSYLPINEQQNPPYLTRFPALPPWIKAKALTTNYELTSSVLRQRIV